jgi:hypothetical protein
MGGRQIALVSTAGFSVLNTGIFWREAKTKRLFSQWIGAYIESTDLIFKACKKIIHLVTLSL